MPKLEKSITINAPVKKVFEYFSKTDLLPEWMPGMVEVSDIHNSEEGVGSTYKWIYKMAGRRFEGKSTTQEFIPGQKVVVKSEGGINSLWTWNFEPEGNGTTLNVVIDYSIPIPIVGKIAEAVVLKQNTREAELALATIKDKVEVD